MNKQEKQLREEMDSLYQDMKEVSNQASEDGWTEELHEKHKGFYDQIQEKKTAIQAIQREEGVGEELTTPVNLNSDEEAAAKAKEIAKPNAGEEDLFQHTGQILSLLCNKSISQERRLEKVGEHQKALLQSGHYKDNKEAQQYVNAVDGFTTLTDSDGGVFLPTSISDRIFDIAEEYGVFSQTALRMPMTYGDGETKIPNLLGELTFHAVNEGSEATASKLTFSALRLKQNKWMTYVPWTSEMDETKGRMLAEILIRKLGEALARMRDNAIVNGDGTSTYHNLKGFVERSTDSDFAEVAQSVAASGNDTFSSIDPDDFLTATLDVAKTIRERGRFALDPDWRVYLRQMKDGNSIPYYANGSGVISIDNNGQFSIYGYPVDFTEAIPSTDGASKNFGVFYVPEYFAFADNGTFIVEQFDTGQIPDTSGTSDAINLLSQDMKASRVKTYFDFELSQITKDSKGAFTVLQTASS